MLFRSARARRFYEDGLGWVRGNQDEGVAFYQMPGAILALWTRPELAEDAGISDAGAAFSGMALAYNARSREEVDALLAEALAAGAEIVKSAHETVWGGYSGYFADLDGHLWEVAHNPFWIIAEDGAVRMA